MYLRIAMSFALLAGIVYGQAQPKPKSQKEIDALQLVFNSQDPDARITAVENLLTNFADTEFKAIALQVAAASAQQKNDYEKMTVYAERTLEADPKNYAAMLMLAAGLASRTREFDLDKEEKLSKSEKYANQAIALAKTAPKPRPDLADAEWDAAKNQYLAQGYEALGLAAVARKKYDDAAKQYELAITTSPDAATYVRLANAYNLGKKPDQAIAALDKLNTVADVHPAIKQAAAAERNTAVKLKGASAPAAPGAATTTPTAPSSPTPAAPATPTAPATSPAK